MCSLGNAETRKMTFWIGKKLLREDRWFKYYEMQPGISARVSKFLTLEVEVKESDLRREWESWNDSERIMFAQAFCAKPEIGSEEEAILEFMMSSKEDAVLSSIAICLTRHSNKAMVLPFLVAQLESKAQPKANFLQALNMLGDRAAIPSVKALHNRLAVELKRAGKEPNGFLITDFFASCAAIDKLEGTTTYRAEIEPFLSHPNGSIGAMAKLWIAGGPPSQ